MKVLTIGQGEPPIDAPPATMVVQATHPAPPATRRDFEIMRSPLRAAILTSLGAIAAMHTGCAGTDKSNPLAGLNLPSPWATLKAADASEPAQSKKTAANSKARGQTSDAHA